MHLKNNVILVELSLAVGTACSASILYPLYHCILAIIRLIRYKIILGLFPDSPNSSASETTLLSVHSRAMFKTAVILSQQLNLTIENQLIGWQDSLTGGSMIDAISNACREISTGKIVGIVGPGYSREAHVIAPLSETIMVFRQYLILQLILVYRIKMPTPPSIVQFLPIRQLHVPLQSCFFDSIGHQLSLSIKMMHMDQAVLMQ